MNPQYARQRSRSLWTWLKETQSNLAAMAALTILFVTVVLAARGYIGLPERMGAVESRATAGEAHDIMQDAKAVQVDEKLDRIICLLEGTSTPMRCAR